MKRPQRTNRNIRLTENEWESFKSLLGAEWLRVQIKKAADRAAKKTEGKDQ